MNERLKTHSKTQKKSADLVSNKLRIGVFQRYQIKCKSVSKKSPRYTGHPDAEARTTYVIKELNDKGIKTEQLQLDTAMWDTAQAKDKMDAWLSGPNANKIEVVIANNDAMAMGAVEALKAHNKSSIPVFGVDALPEALALVKSGALAGTVLNDANNQAKATFDLAKNLADGKGAADGTNWKIDNKVVRVPYVGVDKDNLAEFSKK